MSGRHGRQAVLAKILAVLAEEPWLVRVHETRKPGHAEEICEGLPDDARAVVVCGGDGTVREAASALSGRALPLTVLPLGTENIFAKVFGYRADAQFLARLLEDGKVRHLDMGQANGRVFLTVCGVGFDAEVVARLSALRAGHISHMSYIGPILRTWWGHRFEPLRIVADGIEVFAGRGLAFVGNLNRYAMGLRILARARCDDGLLDLCVFPCSSRLGLAAHSLRTLLGRHTESGGTVYRQCRSIQIFSDDHVPVELDGDLAGHLPQEIKVLERSLAVLLPPSDGARTGGAFVPA